MKLAAAEGITVKDTFISPYDVFTSEEVFLTGTAAEVIPMVTLDGRKIGCGTPGEMTRHLINLFRAHTATGVPFDA
jgi:branched-chain amino acid aminotransferase